MKVTKRDFPKDFEPFEIIIKVETQKEFNNLKILIGNSSADTLKKSVAVNSQNNSNLLDLDCLRVFLQELYNVIK